MLGYHFYNETTRRYVAVFGTVFNDLRITRKDNNSNTVQTMTVPINYGPYQKFLARLEQNPDLRAPQITLPRITFEITNMQYDSTRSLTPATKHARPITSNNASYNTQLTPAPYNITFQLNILTKFQEDGLKIIEQILPFFKPDYAPSVKLIDDMDLSFDIPIILDNISSQDLYDGNFEERRVLTWTLNFTMKAYYFGPVTPKKVIKFVQSNLYADLNANVVAQSITVQPGLTIAGDPTTDINETVPYSDINFDDDWAYIVQIEDFTDG